MQVIDAIKCGKRVRLVGDNLNMTVGVRDERFDRHGKMLHYFGSAILIHDFTFPSASHITPQKEYQSLKATDLLPSSNDFNLILEDYVFMAMHVAVKHIPYFTFLENELPSYILDENSEQLKKKTTVIPLSVMPKNEQRYGDVVDILRHYESLMTTVHKKAGVDYNNIKIHIGGDQLTRERFSSAKLLLIGAPTASDRFEHLSPISSEFFHLAMKMLNVTFKRLYNTNSGRQTGTMKAEQVRIQRNTVNPDVNAHYTADRDFFLSFTDSYIVASILHYFEMDDVLSSPRLLCAGKETSEQFLWAKSHFTKLMQNSVGTFIHRSKFGNFLLLHL